MNKKNNNTYTTVNPGRHVGLSLQWMAILMMVLTFGACTEDDLMPPTNDQANVLHITSVTIDGQDVARSRVVADGGDYPDGIPFNQFFVGFTNGNKLQLVTNGLSAEGVNTNQFYAVYNDSTWTITDTQTGTTPVSLQPTDTWANASISVAFGGEQIKGEVYPIATQGMGIVQGDIPMANSIIYSDWLVASTGNGVTIDTDVKSPTLGATTIELSHAHALLRLPMSQVSVTGGTYIKDGTSYTLDENSLGTLWTVVKIGNDIQYCPLTKVTIGEADYLQTIVPADNDGAYILTGFKAVMNVADGGTLTLDLPLTVGTEQAAGFVALASNTRYPLILTIAPHRATVSLTLADSE